MIKRSKLTVFNKMKFSKESSNFSLRWIKYFIQIMTLLPFQKSYLLKKDLFLFYFCLITKCHLKNIFKKNYFKKNLEKKINILYNKQDLPLMYLYKNLSKLSSHQTYKLRLIKDLTYSLNLISNNKSKNPILPIASYKTFNLLYERTKKETLSNLKASNLFFSIQKNFKIFSQKLLHIHPLYINTNYLNIRAQYSNNKNVSIFKISNIKKNKKPKKHIIIYLTINNRNFCKVIEENDFNASNLFNKMSTKLLWKPFNLLWVWIFKDPIVEKFINYIMKKG